MRWFSKQKLPNPPLSHRGAGGYWTIESSQWPEVMHTLPSWPLVSIVTPSFNQGQFIERTIRSVLSQGYPNLEYLIVDGGSTDQTVTLLKKYQNHLHWISEEDKGQADAVNKGIRWATGEIIGWLNSDDVYYPGALAKVIDFFARHPQADIIYGDAYHINENDEIIEPYMVEDWDYDRLKDRCFICQPAVFFRKTVFNEFGELDCSLNYCMDYEYWLRVGQKKPLMRIGIPLAGSRMYAGNKTLGRTAEVHHEICEMLKKRVGRVPSKWITSYAKVMLHKYEDESSLQRNKIRQNSLFFIYLLWSAFRWKWKIDKKDLKKIVTLLRCFLQEYQKENCC